MTWAIYEVIWRLRTPMHIGRGKVGNLQRTRPYITGRVIWGALTNRLTRNTYAGRSEADDARTFQQMGERIHQAIAYTYFYPALQTTEGLSVEWPWNNPDKFSLRFLRSYASTALDYPQGSAAEGTLHEIEFLSPQTLENPTRPVFLLGYVFVREDAPAGWRMALRHLQFGGERGYGWGAVNPGVQVRPVGDDGVLFGISGLNVQVTEERPRLALFERAKLLAHTRPVGLQAQGDLEPLVGRESPFSRDGYRHTGEHVVFNDVCFVPGSTIVKPATVAIERYGIWEAV